MIRETLPALLLLALMNATQPALASSLIPICTQSGIRWTTPEGQPATPEDKAPACAHGWCTQRRQKAPGC
ncbi:hypothetical protein L6Q21_10665 [Sandaracinobacter sp. RS1-74]|uniref:hypothetical protein n=1 Tax=Sandaracinobacteroides sayramensis TaxID=2913411 RepID=UPI001EDB7DC9|nr:hypothetical protein [Sandaracinobacteroides sayramensis]MCG2841443.1 hypothetical protein [Sandaracinobacteroides sayramensis]